jgi:hypothetical protein
VVKLADTPDLGSGAARREGSSPSPSTINIGLGFLKERFKQHSMIKKRIKLVCFAGIKYNNFYLDCY